VLWAGALLIVLQLGVRGWVAAAGGFFADDVILEGRAATHPLWSAEYLLYDHDGHLMPGAFLLAGVLADAWPLQWVAPAVSLVALQALASLAVFRLLRLLLGDRPVVLVPLALYLFSPVTLPVFAWWSAAVNALPLQIGLAWVAGDAVQLARTRRWRYALTGTAAFALALSFFAKSVLAPFFAFAVVALLLRTQADPTPIRSAVRRCAPLWAGAGIVLVAWGWAYVSLVDSPTASDPGSFADSVGAAARGIARGPLPALFGGPWTWSRTGGPPVAGPPTVLVVAACLTAVTLLAATIRRRRGSGVIWLLVGGHVAASAALMVLGRFTGELADVLPLSLRHFNDGAVVIAAALALTLLCPVRPFEPLLTPRGRRVVVPVAVAVFVGSCLWSTATFARLWADNPMEPYLETARASLAEAGDEPLLDQAVPPEILWGEAYPNNQASLVFAPLQQRPEFATSTSRLRMIDDTGRVVDAQVGPAASVAPGEQPDCGHRLSGDTVTVVPLSGRLFEWSWTVRLDYLASRSGQMQVSLSTGLPALVDVERGAHSVFVRLTGGGDDLRLSTTSEALAVCVPSGVIGQVEPAGSAD
jgi:hypothetical protein